MFGVRTVAKEFEAPLLEGVTGKKRGKVERKNYGDGIEELKVRVRGADVRGEITASFLIGGEIIAQIKLKNGSGLLEMSTQDGHEIPEVKKGHIAEIHFDDDILLRGKFVED